MRALLNAEREHNGREIFPYLPVWRGRFIQIVIAGLTLLVLLATYVGYHAVSQPTTPAAPAISAGGPQPLSPEGQRRLRAVLDSARLTELKSADLRSIQTAVREFYEAYPGTLPWVRKSGPSLQAQAMIEFFKAASRQGLSPEDYDAAGWDKRIARMQSPDPEPALIAFDVALSVSAMRYVSDLHLGRLNPGSAHFGLDLGDGTFDVAAFVRTKLVESPDITSALRTLEPPFPTYHRTLAALNTYRDLASGEDDKPLPALRQAVKPGEAYDGIQQLTTRLALLGDLSAHHKNASTDSIYAGDLVDAVKHFQRRHGLQADGVLNSPTMAELNTPLSHRVAQLELTLERLRWLPHPFEQPMVAVNIPEFRLRAVDEQYHWALLMRVVVGNAYKTQTPVLSANIESIVFRPYWNVPLSIVRDEILPKLEAGGGYLRKHSYQVVDQKGAIVNEETTAEIRDLLYSGRLRVRQRPGPNNSLGLIKFEFPNPHRVYMHGTPATELFSKSRRDFSHGCIRVEDPLSLAAWLLRDKPEWTSDRIRAAMQGPDALRVTLPKPVPVLIVYGTAVVMEDGEVQFFHDIYGQDAALERALADRAVR